MAGTITTSTVGSNVLRSRWAASLRFDATEEMVVAKHFNDGREVERILNTLYVTKIAAVPAASQAASGVITYNNDADSAIAVTPFWATGACQIARSVFNRMDADYQAAKKKQIALGLAAYIDVQGAALATGLSTNLVGSGAVDPDYSLIAELLGKITGASKNHFQLGKTQAWLIYHNTQHRYIIQQINFIAEYISGSGDKVTQSGYVTKGTGFNLMESGNILQSGGITYNMAYTEDAFVLGYNEEPTVLEPQPFDATVKVIGTTEAGVGEVYDEYAGVMMTR